MKARSTIVASGPCLMVNISAGVASGCCPIDKFFAHKRAFTDHSVNGTKRSLTVSNFARLGNTAMGVNLRRHSAAIDGTD